MRLRIGLVIVAIVAALLGTLLIAVYIAGITREAVAGRQPVRVYVAARRVGRNTPVAELAARDLVKKTAIPRRYVADGALTSLKGLGGKVLAAPLARGGQLTRSLLTAPPGGLRLPRKKLAVAVPIDEVALIDGRIKAGDHVAILATFKPDKAGKDTTRILLRRVLVLATGGGKDNGGGSRSGQSGKAGESSLTVAVSPGDTEKLVFAAEEGVVWAALWPPGAKRLPATSGQGLDSLW